MRTANRHMISGALGSGYRNLRSVNETERKIRKNNRDN